MNKPLRMRNVVSFGMQNQPPIMQPDMENQVKIRCEESCQFDFGKQINDLGVEVVDLNDQSLTESCALNFTQLINRQKIIAFVQGIRRNLFLIKQQIKSLRKQQQQFAKNLDLKSIKQIVTSLKIEEQLKTEESELSSNFQFPIQKQFYSSESTPSLLFKSSVLQIEKYQKQIQFLKKENQFQQKQIQNLKMEISTIKNLSKKKQDFFQQKLKLKQIQWNRKLNEILHGQYKSSIKKDESLQNKYKINRSPYKNNIFQTQSFSSRVKLNTQPQQIQNHSVHLNVSQFNHKKASPSKLSNRQINTSKSSYKLLQSKNNSSFNDSKFSHKLKQRKKSTDLSFYLVNEKIRNFQASIRQQIQKINKN